MIIKCRFFIDNDYYNIWTYLNDNIEIYHIK